MTSADFLAHRNRIYSKTSPGKSFFLPSMPATSTYLFFCILRASQSCGCSPKQICLLCRFCSSVPNFAVSLPSVHASRQTTLRLAYVSENYLRTQGTFTLWKNTLVVRLNEIYLYFWTFSTAYNKCALLNAGHTLTAFICHATKAVLVSSRQGEFHPKPLTESYVKLSLHTALLDSTNL